MSIPVIKINDQTVKLMKIDSGPEQFKGDHIFPRRYMNGGYFAPSRNGKTVLMHNAIDAVVSPSMTKIILFCDSHNRDSYYVALKKKWDEAKINYYAARSFIGVDNEGNHYNDLNIINKELDKKPTCDYVIIFDDISDSIKDKAVATLLKKSRHSNIWVFISSQYALDAKPDTRANLGYLMLRRTDDEKLKKLHKEFGLSINFGAFVAMYKYATKNPFSFLYVCKDPEEYRINFDKKFDISQIES